MFSKALVLGFLALQALNVAAVPVTEDMTDVAARELAESEFEWRGRIFADDAEESTIKGDIRTVYGKILELNPNYVAAEVNPTTSDSNILARGLQKRDDEARCGAVMATGDKMDIADAMRFLYNVGGTCGAPRGECRRMTCENTTGTYICGEATGNGIPCSQAADIINHYIHHSKGALCCRESSSAAFSFYHNRDWSIWVGYANCNHPSNSRPTRYSYSNDGGVNGLCLMDFCHPDEICI